MKSRNEWLKEIERAMNPQDFDYAMKFRRTGKSTGIGLTLIGMAIQNPGTPIHLQDHLGSGPNGKDNITNIVKDVIKQLDLKGLKFDTAKDMLIYSLDW